ncbi:MAG: bifunctional aminoglycoside phosphotransferase/ATP-binding protein [Massilia sp.]
MNDPCSVQERLIAALMRRFEREGRAATLVETHISWVVVLDELTYKFKKARRLEFLDYASPQARRYYCEEEIRLNRRYAEPLYLGVSTLTGPANAPCLDGDGPVLDYAVRLRTFPQTALWTRRLADGLLGSGDAARLAAALARFHASATTCPAGASWGSATQVAKRTAADLRELRVLSDGAAARQVLDRLDNWHSHAARRLSRLLDWRRAHGAIRECHGDLHCGNILTLGDAVLPFDGIEFNDSMRWIDTMQDLAFAWMDLQFHGRADLAARLLNDYLQLGGDYYGLAVLPYYRVQRALVRAKVAALRGDRALGDAYLRFAAGCTVPTRGVLLATHGLSGSGKSTVCDRLVEPLCAVQVRSDMERKRLPGVPVGALYCAETTELTYARLARVARRALGAGLPVLVDAAFLQGRQRQAFRRLAHARAVPFLLLDVQADPGLLAGRLRERAIAGRDPSDADEAVLAQQRATAQALAQDELPDSLPVTADAALSTSVRAALAERGYTPERAP